MEGRLPRRKPNHVRRQQRDVLIDVARIYGGDPSLPLLLYGLQICGQVAGPVSLNIRR